MEGSLIGVQKAILADYGVAALRGAAISAAATARR